MTACQSNGFYAPMTMDLTVPDGPPEYKAGWHDGCSSSLAVSGFQNARFNPLTMGNGMYQHDQLYQLGYSNAIAICAIHPGDFTAHPMFQGPLE